MHESLCRTQGDRPSLETRLSEWHSHLLPCNQCLCCLIHVDGLRGSKEVALQGSCFSDGWKRKRPGGCCFRVSFAAVERLVSFRHGA